MPPRGSFWAYLRAAFSWRWNLLAMGAGVVFSFLSRKPDVMLPLLTAMEIAYLGLLSTNARFRKSVEARHVKTDMETQRRQQLRRILSVLPRHDVERFDSIRERCATLNELARQFRGAGPDQDPRLSDMHTDSLDRLLWMFLKLLYSKNALDRFLECTFHERPCSRT
ncbi:hypothetical protein ACFL0Q_05245, partial [Thermodesulfobacteriota bacterium]